MIRLAVFDLAGTTVHDGDAVASCFAAALAVVGVAAGRAAIDSVMGLHKPEAIGLLLAAAGRPVTEAVVGEVHDDFVRRMKQYYATSPDVREIPGASAAFAALRAAGVKVAVDTGFGREIVEVLLGRLGWLEPGVLDGSVCSDEVERGRPHPDMIRALMAKFGVEDARQVAKVGDTRADLEEGHNAGCGLNVGVTSGASSREQLLACPHSHVVASVADVPALLR